MSLKLNGQKIVIATHNKGKLEEFRQIFAPHGVNAVSAGELGLAARRVPVAVRKTRVGPLHGNVHGRCREMKR